MYNIPLIKPYITDEVKQGVMNVLESGYLTEGPITKEFERAVASYVGASWALAVTSCTTGLELALRCLNIGPGDEVIVPDYTYPATAAVVNIVGATAVLVDIDPQTLLIDYTALEKAITKNTKAVLPVSLFGNPLDWTRLSAVKQKYDLFIIEDAACALGSSFKGRMTGTMADISVFSHHPRKFITTGEGGTICTDNPEWMNWMASYKHFGAAASQSRKSTHFERTGTNYKMSNILAAIGLEQMKKVDELLTKRQIQAQRYRQLMKGFQGFSLPETTCGGTHSFQTFCTMITNRDGVMDKMREQGIEVQIGTYSLHMHDAFKQNGLCRVQGNMTASKHAFEQTLALPLYHEMAQSDQDIIISELIRLTQKL